MGRDNLLLLHCQSKCSDEEMPEGMSLLEGQLVWLCKCWKQRGRQ